MTIGKHIQKIRKEKGFTQKGLGDKLGVSASMIGQYENDLRNPKLETLEKIASALNIGVSDLLGKNEIIHESSKTFNQAFSVYDTYRHLLEDVLSSGKLPNNYVDEIRNQCPTKEELNSAFSVISAAGMSYMLKKLITPRANFLTDEEIHTINTLINVLTEEKIKKL